MNINLKNISAILIILGSLTASLLIILAPSLSIWGQKHLPHESEKTLPLPSGQQIEQTFIWEYDTLDTAVFLLDTTRPLPKTGRLELAIDTPRTTQSTFLNVQDIPPSGTAVFNLDPPLSASAGDPGVLRIKLPDNTARVWFKYQIDASIYSQGKLIYYPNQRQKGDLAFHLRYQRPALNNWPLQIAYAVTVLMAGSIITWTIFKLDTAAHIQRHRQARAIPRGHPQMKYVTAILIGLLITLFYAAILIRPGLWPGPTDFTKEVSYVKSSSQALKSFTWPLWSHYTCGGMGLLGNPESTAFSLSTLLALFSTPELALWLTLVIEAGLGAAGVYLLSRQLKISPSGSLVASLTSALSAAYAYKIIEGFAMLGGIVAFTPWIFLFYFKGKQSNNNLWYLFSGLGLAAIFWRGDVHVILGVIAILAAWTIIASIKTNSYQPFLPLIIIGAVTFLGSSLKILPYLEQPDLINKNVAPHSIQVTANKLWDDIFLKLQPRETKLPIQRGLPENFGYAGAYLGIFPLLLALLGITAKHRCRWHLLLALIIILAIAEGSLYEYVLRRAPPLDALLRMPTRFLLLATLLISIFAGLGTDKLLKLSRKILSKTTTHTLAAIIILLIVADLGFNTYSLLNRYAGDRVSTKVPAANQPTLAPHRNSSPDQNKHASVLLAGNFLLPQVCGDQNNPPEFLADIEDQTPISSNPVTLSPNQINIQQTSGPKDIIIKARYISAWQTDQGNILPSNDGSIHFITTQNSPAARLNYFSPTKPAQQLLALIILIIALYSTFYLILLGSSKR